QIRQSDFRQEHKSLLDFFQNLVRHRSVALGSRVIGGAELKRGEIVLCFLYRQRPELPNRLALYAHGFRSRGESSSLATVTARFAQKLCELLVSILLAVLRDLPQKRNETDKSRSAIATIKHLILGFLGQASERLIDIDVVLFCQFLQQPLYGTPQAVAIFRSKSRNAMQSFVNRLPRVGDEQFRIEVPLKTHATAFCTSALPAIEREQPRI